MPNTLALIGEGVKALLPRASLSYAPTQGWSGAFWPGAGLSVGRPSLIAEAPEVGGDPLHNYVIAAAVNAIALALPDAPPYLEQRTETGWKRLDDHPVLDLLRSPHPDLDDADIWSITAAYRITRGEAYWVVQFGGGGTPAELVPFDPLKVRTLGTETELIAGYEITTEAGRIIAFDKSQIIHFRHLPHPANLRHGWTPLSAGTRQMAGANAASTYHTSLLMNGAVSSWLISVKDGGANVSPEQFEAFVGAMRRKYSGRVETAGGIDGVNLPLEVQRMAWSPDEMAIDKLIDYYEQTLCALTGISKRVLDLGQDPTYANLSAAINDLWERRLVPMRNKDAATLTNQLLPLFGLERGAWRVRFDFSHVAALQENVDQLFARWRDLYQAGGCDLYTLQTKIGMPDVPEAYKERFKGDKAGGAEPEIKRVGGGYWDESEHPRDEDGKFADAGGSRRISHFPERGVWPGHLPQSLGRVGRYYFRSTKEVQNYAEEHNERAFASNVGGESFPDSEEIDVGIRDAQGKLIHGIELKTMVENRGSKIRMRGAAMERKKSWQKTNNALLHTVVFDDRKVFNAKGPGMHDDTQRRMYYRRGGGSFSLANMEEFTTVKKLRELMDMPDNQLPEKAQPTQRWVGMLGRPSRRQAKFLD